ncbi:glycosidase [Arthrobacter phage Gordon]|uniref:Glycosidase n=1 Tax=Arthrobacter phage Gordon TaxID=1772298 RepID=A0A0U4JXU5_9CAUD|nr:tail spike protein [Arthrobacter phage Gordon]ALY08978.1 glycosidase [Arthrobacter phage Gordon]
MVDQINFLIYPRIDDEYQFPSDVREALVKSPEFENQMVMLDIRKKALYNVLDFGAVPDGITDCAPAFNAAIQLANDSGGGTVLVPPGAYTVFSPIGNMNSYIRHVSLAAAVPRRLRWNFGDGALDPQGKPWIAGAHIRAGGNHPVIGGMWDNSEITGLALDADMRGSAAVKAHFSKSRFSWNEVLGWSGYGMLLNNGDLTDDLGFLNHIEYNNISDTGEEVGVALQLEYRFIDSWISRNNIESYGADIQINSGGPFRIIENHLNGNRSPLHNILINGGVRECLIQGNILEGSREEAIKYVAPGWLTSPERASISVSSNIVRQNNQAGNKPTFGFYGATGNAGFYAEGLTVTGNVITTDYQPTYVMELTKFRDVTAMGNYWRTGHQSNLAPVRASTAQTLRLLVITMITL